MNLVDGSRSYFRWVEIGKENPLVLDTPLYFLKSEGWHPSNKNNFFVKVVYLFIFYMILGGGTGNSQVVIERPFDNG